MCEGFGRCGSSAGRRQLESVLLTRAPFSFHPSSALTRPSLATSAHLPPPTPPRGPPGHTRFMEPRPGGDPAATWNRHFVLASNHGCDNMLFLFSSIFLDGSVLLCVCIRIVWGTLQQNEWLPRLEKLLNIPPVLCVSNSAQE